MGKQQWSAFSKGVAGAIGLKENDRVELIQSADAITIKKASPTQHKTLEERLTAFYGKPIEQIGAFHLRKWSGARQRAVKHGNRV